MEFERLAQTWERLADDLERAQTFTESPPDPHVVTLRQRA
jgi:hypothetical protein